MLRGDSRSIQFHDTTSQQTSKQSWAGVLKRGSPPSAHSQETQYSAPANAENYSGSPPHNISSSAPGASTGPAMQQHIPMNQQGSLTGNQEHAHSQQHQQEQQQQQQQQQSTQGYGMNYLGMFGGMSQNVLSGSVVGIGMSHAQPPPAFLPAPSTAAARLPAAVIHGADGPEKTSFRRWKWDAASLTTPPPTSAATVRAPHPYRPRKDVAAAAMDAFETETMLLASMPCFTEAKAAAMAAAAAFRAVAPLLQSEDRIALQTIFVTKPPRECLAAVVEVANRASMGTAGFASSGVVGSKNMSSFGSRHVASDIGQGGFDSFMNPFQPLDSGSISAPISSALNTGGYPSDALTSTGLTPGSSPFSSAIVPTGTSLFLSPSRNSCSNESRFANSSVLRADSASDDTSSGPSSDGASNNGTSGGVAFNSVRNTWSQQQHSGVFSVWGAVTNASTTGGGSDDTDGGSVNHRPGSHGLLCGPSVARASQSSSLVRGAFSGSPLDTVRWSNTIQRSVPSSALDANAPCFTMSPKR